MNAHSATRRPVIHVVDAWSSIVLLGIFWAYLAFGETSLLGETLAVPLVLLIPGGLLVMMLPSRPKDLFFQFALAVGLSIAMCIVVGLLLNVLPTGIDHRTWACALGLVSMTEAVVVASLRSRAAGNRSRSPSMLAQTDVKLVIVAALALLAILGGCDRHCGLGEIECGSCVPPRALFRTLGATWPRRRRCSWRSQRH